MKVNGQVLTGPRIVEVYLPTNGGEVCFKFRALSAKEDFSQVMTEPKPPTVLRPGGVVHKNTDDPNYKLMIKNWVEAKFDWQFLKSISETDGLEWTTVDLNNPETWKNWKTELREHFNDSVCDKLFAGFLEAQYITEEMMEKARARFLIGALDQLNLSFSQKDEAGNTPSGEPANA